MRKEVAVSECVPGDILAEDVYIKKDQLVLSADTVLDDNKINNLKNLGVDTVQVYEKDKEYEEFLAIYEDKEQETKKVLNNLASGKDVNMEEVNSISDSLFEDVTGNYDIVSYLSKLKEIECSLYSHSINVSVYCMMLGRWLKLPEDDIKNLITLGLLHDLGKLQLPKDILNKSISSLAAEEKESYKKHPEHGYYHAKLIKDLDPNVAEAVFQHHEREDGSGFPQGLKGNRINSYAKVLAVADEYDSLLSGSVDGNKITPFHALDRLEREAWGQFDVKAAKTFLNNIYTFYIGLNVKLSNEKIGQIASILPINITRPIVKTEKGELIDLGKETNIDIVEVI